MVITVIGDLGFFTYVFLTLNSLPIYMECTPLAMTYSIA